MQLYNKVSNWMNGEEEEEEEDDDDGIIMMMELTIVLSDVKTIGQFI